MATGTGSQSGTSDQGTTFGRSGQRSAGSDALGGAASGMNRLADDAQDALERASDSASEYAERLTTTGTQLMEDARDYIAAYPMRTIGIAAAAGFLIARMMR